MAQRSFKTDESFLEKLAIGAIGTKKVIDDLRNQGHNPVELERGSTGYKIWKTIKIKRVRVPDILCVNSGIRVESRAKSNLVISMSHSSSDETRGWDYGLKDDDFTALVVCQKNGEEPIDWVADNIVQYIKISDLRKALKDNKVIQEKPKGAEEGFESRLTWPSVIASSDGELIAIDNRIKFKRDSDGRIISLVLSKKNISLKPCVDVGQKIKRNQIIASVVQIHNSIPHRKIDNQEYYRTLLTSLSISERYGAAKAYSFFDGNVDIRPLVDRIQDDSEHIYVKLEAAAALARRNDQRGYYFIEQTLKSDYLEHRLEAVIILGEIRSDTSALLLVQTLLDINQNEEIRSGSAWALGELNIQSSIQPLIESFNDLSLPVRVESARALKKMCDKYVDVVLDSFKLSSEIERPGVSWALGRFRKWEIKELLKRIDPKNMDMRQWAAFIIGNFEQNMIINDIEELKQKDPQLYFAVTVLWKITTSWVYQLKEY